MRVKVFERADGATVVLPLDLHGTFPPDYHGALVEIGDAELDLDCLSPEFVTVLGLKGYCAAQGTDAASVLECIVAWKAAPQGPSLPCVVT